MRIAGTRRGFELVGITREAVARERCAAMAAISARLAATGHGAHVPRVLELAAKATTARAWDAVMSAAETLASGAAAPATGVPTFGELAREWCSGDLARRFPDDVPTKSTSGDDLGRLRKWAFPVLEDVPVDLVTLDHARQVLAGIPPTKSRTTRRHVAQLMIRVMRWAVYPCRYVAASPLPKGFAGGKSAAKAKVYLYPAEDRALLACAAVPLANRVLYGVLAREGMRAEEARSLTWGDVDLERGSVRLDTNKTADPRAWAMAPDVVRALRWWCEQVPHERADLVFPGLDRPYWAAHVLREHLRAAGVDRAELYQKTEARQPIRLHDLRATFVTVSLATGRTETWIADRTGHRSSAMINTYRRLARTHAELAQGALAPLDEALGLTHERPIGGSDGGDSGYLGAQNMGQDENADESCSVHRSSNPLGDATKQGKTSPGGANMGQTPFPPGDVTPRALALAAAIEALASGHVRVLAAELRELLDGAAKAAPGATVLPMTRRNVRFSDRK